MKRDAENTERGMFAVEMSLRHATSLSHSLSLSTIVQFNYTIHSHVEKSPLFLSRMPKKKTKQSENHSNRKQVANERTSHCYLSWNKRRRTVEKRVLLRFDTNDDTFEARQSIKTITREIEQNSVTRERQTHSLWKGSQVRTIIMRTINFFYNPKRYVFFFIRIVKEMFQLKAHNIFEQQ